MYYSLNLISLFQFFFQALSRSPCWQSTPGISAQKLLSYGLKSRAPSTVKKYLKEGVLFQQFLQQNRLSETLPAKAEHVSLYLCFLLDKRRTSVVSTAYATLKWIHGLLPIAYNPLDSGLYKKLVDAERRQRPIRLFPRKHQRH